ncbi:hypothetical protein D8B20_07345 [Candidatus Pantoea soli]|uniref:Uncharacterized protein n=2 Tax=Candidatus Pantoea soli TaxID=3098669 RepID=A0A518XBY5_9GAMM|nr:hypothetical protein D8B20_07345 [Pantoea soli]
MDFKTFEARLHQWEHLHFTAIALQQRDGKLEIYATAAEHQTLSQLYLCRAQDENGAGEQVKQFRSWLHKLNLGRTRRKMNRSARHVAVNASAQAAPR